MTQVVPLLSLSSLSPSFSRGIFKLLILLFCESESTILCFVLTTGLGSFYMDPEAAVSPMFVSWSDESVLLCFIPPAVGPQWGLCSLVSLSRLLEEASNFAVGLQQIVEDPSYCCSIP